MRILTLFIVLFSFAFEAKSQELDFAWTKYDTSKLLDLHKLSNLTKLEIQFSKSISDFHNNRGRLTLTDSTNKIYPKELQNPDFPLPCKCAMSKDTIYMTAALGLMSGLGIILAINKHNFASTFFQEADNTNIFKRKIEEPYTAKITVSAIRQKLTLFKRPSFTNKEFIIGSLDAQFKSFYELDSASEPALKRNYKAKIFFVCRVYSSVE